MNTKLPESWVEVTLGEIAEWGSGGTPSRTMPHYYGGDIPWIKTGDLNDSLLEDVEEYISEEGLKKSSAKIFPKGSVAVAMYGATIGKSALLGIDAATNQACAVAQPHSGIDNRYLFFYIQSQKKNFIDKGKGGAQPNISQMIIKAHSFPLAPSQEQKRIADKLDNLYDHLDFLHERLDKIPSLLKQFRENVLMQAVTGKLTEEWRKNRKPKKGPANGSTSFRIPNIWQWHKLGSLTKRISYGTSKKSDNEGKVPVLRMGNLQNGKLDWHDLKYSSDKKEIASYSLEPGDVLFNRTNSPELVGKTSIYEGEQPAIYAGYIIRIVTTEELNPYYLNFVLNSKYGRDWAWQVKSDGVSQSNINAKKLSAFEIPLPETDEQLEIVKQINGLFSIADRIEILYNELTTKLRKLPLTILGKAFAGQLVSQDPNDEPASSLLQKITQMKAK